MDPLDKAREKGDKYYIPPPEEGIPPPEEEGLIDKTLPFEDFQHVLSYLEGLDMQSVVSVSKLWTARSIDTAKRQEHALIQGFASFVAKNLPKESYATQIDELSKIGSNKKILDSINLIEVKSSIDQLMKGILNILKDFKKEDLIGLKKSSKEKGNPVFFENIFDLAITNKEIAEANANPDEGKKSVALGHISGDLRKKGYFEKAIAVAYMMPDTAPWDANKSNVLLAIVSHAVGKVNIEKLIQVANRISKEEVKSNALRAIADDLRKKGYFEKAIEVANMMPEGEFKSAYLEDIRLQ